MKMGHFQDKISLTQNYHENVKKDEGVYITSNLDPDIIYKKRNEIVQRLLELAYHHYRKW